MENIYPICNPAPGLSELINKKLQRLESVDKTKYAGYYKQTCAEIRELEYFHEALSALKDFECLVEIQKSIDHLRNEGISILNIKIPLDNRFDMSSIALLNFLEGRQHD